MPQENHYWGLNLAESLRELARHHYEGRTRHISHYEYLHIRKAANVIELSGESSKPNEG